jgi:SAM-dependent methyltransferase
MSETSKSIFGKLSDSRYATRYLVGAGLDIGAGADSLAQFYELFPLMKDCRAWDVDDGDAQYLDSIEDESLDFVHSAHCLEHLVDPHVALGNWLRVLKPGGHLICLIPDEDLYEQGVFPSMFNPDHKHTFTIAKASSWSPQSINVLDLLGRVADRAEVKKIELLDATYRYNLARDVGRAHFDQTQTWIGESAIEFVLRKRAPQAG